MSWLSKQASSFKDDVSHVSSEIKKQAKTTAQDIRNIKDLSLKDISLNNLTGRFNSVAQQAYKINIQTFSNPKLDVVKAYLTTATVAALTGGTLIIPPKSIVKLQEAQRGLSGKALGIIPKDRQEAIDLAQQILYQANAQQVQVDPEIVAMANGDVKLEPNYLLWGGIFAATVASSYIIIKLIKEK